MKRHLVIAPSAQKDLVALTLRLAELAGAAAAARVAVDLEERFKLLLHSPLMGYVGALVLDEYVIVYRVHTGSIEIARVWHGKQKRPLKKPSKPTSWLPAEGRCDVDEAAGAHFEQPARRQ